MRSSLCIFLISLLICQNLCANTSSKSQDIQFLESIRRTDFGKTLLQSLQLTAKTHSKDAVQSILVILNQMLEDENDAQAQADAAWEEENGQCIASVANLEDEIAAASEKILENNVNMDILNSAIAGSQASLDEANDKLVTSTNALQNIVDQREAEHSTFLQDIADISATITALQQGKDLINKLVEQEEEAEAEEEEQAALEAVTSVGEAAYPEPEEEEAEEVEQAEFFQKKAKKSVFSQFTAHITNANLKKTTKFHGFVTALLTMLDGPHIFADQALVDQVLRLIDHLVEMLSAELTTKAAAESDAQLSFDERSTSLSSDITNLNSKIAELQSDITDKSAQVADLVADNSNLDVEIANKSTELADTQTTCQDDQNAYESTSEQRSGEIDIINQVINIFQTRFDNVAAYLNESAF